MLSHTDLKKGIQIIINGQPVEVLEASLMFKGRGSSVMQTKLKNLVTGNVVAHTFRPSDTIEEADLKRIKLVFVYSHRGKFVFTKQKDGHTNQSERIELAQEQVGDRTQFLKQNQEIDGLVFKDKIISIILPIKVCLKVIEAPPGIKAGRAEAGTKQITLETGAKINTPLFLKQGDIVEVNTETGQYVRRVE